MTETISFASPQEGTRPARELKPCGTEAAYRRHLRRGERCEMCKQGARLACALRTGADPFRPGPDETPDHRPIRNGIPVRLYVYRGSGADAVTGEVVTL